MRQRGLFLPLFLLLLIIFVLWSPGFLWRLHRFGESGGQAINETDILKAENAYLKSLLAEKENQILVPSLSFATISANVYSRYPLNFKHELVIDKGSRDKVSDGAVVLASVTGSATSSSRAFLIGSVSQAMSGKSTVRTIFDYRFKDAVQIGSERISGLLVGGLSPVITTIPKDARLSPGDVVVSASQDFPYGVVIGRLKEIHPSSDKLFKEGSLDLSYDLNNLTVVLVGTN